MDQVIIQYNNLGGTYNIIMLLFKSIVQVIQQFKLVYTTTNISERKYIDF